MKKLFLVFSAITVAILLALSASAWSSGDCSDTLTWTLDDNGILTIAGEGAMIEYSWNNPAPWEQLEYTAVVIEDGVTSVSSAAFMYATALKTIEIGADVAVLGDAFVESCYELEAINVDPDNNVYASIDGVLFDKACETLIQYPIGNAATEYTVPNSVSTLGDYAFSGHQSLKTLLFPIA